MDRNPLRMNQFYMKEMTAYAASLTGAKGKALEPETITVGPKQLSKINDDKPANGAAGKKPEAANKQVQKGKAGGAKKGSKTAAAGLSKKDEMIADNEKRRDVLEGNKAFSAWAMKKKEFDSVTSDQERYLRADEYLKSLDSTKTNYLEGEVNTYALQSLLSWWSEVTKSSKKSEGYHIVALIWTRIRIICSLTSAVSKDIETHVKKVCDLLEIGDVLSPFKSSPTDRKLSFAFKYPPQTQHLKIEMSQSEFQLNHCGPYMDRNLDAKPDARVSSFVPDGWQRDVLDQLDANKSVFVVAPTSAGKTFISFYAMEQVLRADNDGVLIYVAPTKALVNQIAAEVQGDYPRPYHITFLTKYRSLLEKVQSYRERCLG
jgi:superfamily II RNA helicase